VRILLTTNGGYPARGGGPGAWRVIETLAQGLGELGHDVLLCAQQGYAEPLPHGVTAAARGADADIYHFDDYPFDGAPPPPRGKAWVRTCHRPFEPELMPFVSEHFIFVSRTHAAAFGSSRWVWNGIDPRQFVYSETKDDYFLFIVSDLDRAESKGLPIAIAAAERAGARLLVAGNGVPSIVSPNVEYVGYVDGAAKADLLAGARALFFPTQIGEAFGLVAAEALMSGTPVIGSRHGAVPEVITPDTGFLCDTVDDYAAAAERAHEISPAACRARAMSEFHYLRMAARYVAEYEIERLAVSD
jgi:glycosyltransferase involved in cell wall biosynthesis